MATRIGPSNIRNLQQMEAVVSGPDRADRLFMISGQLGDNIVALSAADNGSEESATFTALVGPVLTRGQFMRAIASANITGSKCEDNQSGGLLGAIWKVTDFDAVWDDDSGQVELIIGTTISGVGQGSRATLLSIGFTVNILAELGTVV